MKRKKPKRCLEKGKACAALVCFFVLMVAVSAFAVAKRKAAAAGATLSWTIADHPAWPATTEWPLIKKMEEVTNGKIDLQPIPLSDYDQKIALIVASGDLTDIVNVWSPDPVIKAANAGFLMSISDKQEIFKNYFAALKKWGFYDSYMKNCVLKDGKTYSFTEIYAYGDLIQAEGWLVREDLLEKYSLDMPKSIDDLFNLLTTVKRNEPDNLGFTFRFDGTWQIKNWWGTVFGIPNMGAGGLFDYMYQYGDKWECNLLKPNFKAMVTYLNKLYEAGVLDPEIPTSKSELFLNKTARGLWTVCGDWINEINNLTETAHEGGSAFAKFSPMNPPTSPYQPTPMANPLGEGGIARSPTGNIISAKLEKDEARFNTLVVLMEWLNTREGSYYTSLGIPGETFTDEGGKLKFIDPDILHPDGSVNRAAISAKLGSYHWPFFVLRDVRMEPSYMPAVTKEYFEGQGDMLSYKPVLPILSVEEKEEFDLVGTPIADLAEEMLVKFIYGKEPLANYDAFVTRVKDIGLEKLVDLVNQAARAK